MISSNTASFSTFNHMTTAFYTFYYFKSLKARLMIFQFVWKLFTLKKTSVIGDERAITSAEFLGNVRSQVLQFRGISIESFYICFSFQCTFVSAFENNYNSIVQCTWVLACDIRTGSLVSAHISLLRCGIHRYYSKCIPQ